MCAAAAARAQLSCSAQPQSPGGAPTAAAGRDPAVVQTFSSIHASKVNKRKRITCFILITLVFRHVTVKIN